MTGSGWLRPQLDPDKGQPHQCPPGVHWSECLLDYLSEGGSIMRWAALRSQGAPHVSARRVYAYASENPDWHQRFRISCEMRADLYVDLATEVALSPEWEREITLSQKDGKTVKKKDALGARRLAFESLMRLAACFCPQRYGINHQKIEHSGAVSLEKLVLDSQQKPPEPTKQ